MNRRNWQVFGPTKKTRYAILGTVVLVLIVIAAWLVMRGDSPTAAAVSQPTNQLTGASIEQQRGQEQEQQQLEQQQQNIPEEQPKEEDRKYFTYREQCAFDMKQRQDDVTDATSNRDAYQKELTVLSEEYERKKKEIEERYVGSIERLKGKVSEVQKDLDDVQRRYDTTKATCDAQQPR